MAEDEAVVLYACLVVSHALSYRQDQVRRGATLHWQPLVVWRWMGLLCQLACGC